MIQPSNTALQHTRCLLALTATTAFIDQLTPTPHASHLDTHIFKIRRWLTECQPGLQRKKLSAGARRDLDAAFTSLVKHTVVHDLEGDALFQRWGASMWAALTLLEDCRNTCPQYFCGRHWHYLLQTMTTLSMGLYKLEPDIAPQGTEIYEQVAL